MLCHKLIRSCSTFHHSAGWECQAALKRNISGTQLVWNPVVCHSLDDWQQTNPDIGQSPTLLWFFRSFFKHLCNYPTIYRKRKGKKSCMSPLSVMRLNHKNAYQYQSLFIIHIHVKNFQSIFFSVDWAFTLSAMKGWLVPFFEGAQLPFYRRIIEHFLLCGNSTSKWTSGCGPCTLTATCPYLGRSHQQASLQSLHQ